MKRSTICLIIWVVACVDDGPASEPSQPMVELGDPCHWVFGLCVDESTMLRCVDGYWSEVSCESYCETLGADVSGSTCDLDLVSATPAQLCGCEPGPTACEPGEGHCDDTQTISWCGEDWAWQQSDCAEVCGDIGLASNGCDQIGDKAVCLCTNTGTACMDEPSVCADISTLSACQAGLWTELDCAEVCAGAGSCDPGADGGAACVCG